MKKDLFLLHFVMLSALSLSAQITADSHTTHLIQQKAIPEENGPKPPAPFIIAGSNDGLVPGNRFVSLHQSAIPFGGTAEMIDSIDLNEDGIFDVAPQIFLCNTFDCVASYSIIAGMHGGFTFVLGAGDPKNFAFSDTIKADANWNTSPSTPYFGQLSANGSGFGGPFSGGEWLNNNPGYLGFRLVTPASDTLLGWLHIDTYTAGSVMAYLEIDAWAVEHDPAQTPFVEVSVSPDKTIYCPGDTVVFYAKTIGAGQFAWHFWDGSTVEATTATKVLPDHPVSAEFTAINAIGETVYTKALPVSPLKLFAADVFLTCDMPQVPLTASTNIPAAIYWILGMDTIAYPLAPVLDYPGFITVFAVDIDGCVKIDSVEIIADFNAPEVSIEILADGWIVAHSSTPGVMFVWTHGNDTPIEGDSIKITGEGVYEVTAYAPNGCYSTASVIVLMGSTEANSLNIRLLPNPVGQYLEVENESSEMLYLTLYDVAGRNLIELGASYPQTTVTFDLEKIPAGLYGVAGINKAGKRFDLKKLVKM